MIIAHINSDMIAKVAVVSICIKEHQITQFNFRNLCDFSPEGIIALCISGSGQCVAHCILENVFCKTGAVKGIRAVSAAYIRAAEILLCIIHHCFERSRSFSSSVGSFCPSCFATADAETFLPVSFRRLYRP